MARSLSNALIKLISFGMVPRVKVRTKLIVGSVSLAVMAVCLALGFLVFQNGGMAQVLAIGVAASGILGTLSLVNVVLARWVRSVDKRLIELLKKHQEK